MKIGTLGFPDDQLKKLDKILTLSKSRTMALVEFDPACLPDLLLVMGDTLDAHTEVASLPDDYRARLILVNKQKPANSDPAHIKLPFISSRVLRTLEAYEPLPTDDDKSIEQEVMQEAAVAETSAIDQATALEQERASPVPAAQPGTLEADAQEANASTKENPFSKYDAQIEEVRRQQAEREAQQQDQHYAVLVVDDSHPMQQMLAKELQQMDQPVNIDFADDGETALEKAESNHYDFIFLDIMMPGIDGFETCTRLRQMPALKKTPIIMLSSKTSPLDEVKGIMAGSSTYLTKPIDHVEFQKVIKRVSRWVSEFKK
ncbi:response regulator [Marinobacterium weihaiense]|uniref:Response regulator n=1 Tax=Marinobacterium weihaiense TaxID=2851016 RepID=A0ABS6MEI1_9GAMM|nr:response regulator [Marinobacterium weihaiense]MBV0934530.1 response regulator [Marinobacterium weihaiense]